MANIKYSLVIPVYNLANYIERTLGSICDNDLTQTEIILINDGSNDGSWPILRKFVADKEHADIAAIQLLKQENSGVSAARNVGLESAKGEYVIFFDGDDLCDGSMFDRLNAGADGSDMIIWRFYTDDNGEKKISQPEFEQSSYSGSEFMKSLLRAENRIRIGSFAVRRQMVEEHELRFTEGCAICEDVEFMYKAVLCAERVKTCNDAWYTYVKREGSAINTFDLRRFEAPYAIERVYRYAVEETDIDDEYILDSLRYGMYITHCMYSFDSYCKGLKDKKDAKEFLEAYKTEFPDIEKKIEAAKKHMKYKPTVFSGKRLWLFLMSRRLYVMSRIRKLQPDR
ncbi:MAG: glycosyltransferase [Lachnospiraceae bacterium]|nr:glycosyltransferase [Lachnospiraceae bacterium]